ncbi:MAG: methyltransferase domain-containing protein [Candidatus Sulfotelmatobacter sp.]
MDSRNSRLSERDQAEIERSAEEARKIVLRGVDRAQIDRYRNPPRDTPFALEYAFHLLGDARDKTLLDFGCGAGQNIVPLVERGARVIGMDISPDLITLARKRLNDGGLEARLQVGSAYDTGLPDESVDVIFCIALIHHLDIARVVEEMARILVKGGVVILQEPVRFSRTYAFLRGLLPAHEDISEFEHPLTREELRVVTERFKVLERRYFRLPFMPLVQRFLRPVGPAASRLDRWILKSFPGAELFATVVAMKLQK